MSKVAATIPAGTIAFMIDEKANWIVNELGVDGAINYKSEDLDAQLAKLAPNDIDMYFHIKLFRYDEKL